MGKEDFWIIGELCKIVNTILPTIWTQIGNNCLIVKWLIKVDYIMLDAYFDSEVEGNWLTVNWKKLSNCLHMK